MNAKYIKTKDGIFEFEKVSHFIAIEDILDFSNEIESLCDEFIIMYCGAHIFIQLTGVGTYYYKYDEEQIFSKYYPIGNEEIYGAIWTDDGLKYVAKMNNGTMGLIKD